MSVRWKILAVCLGLVLIPIYLLNRHAIDFFDRFTRRELETTLRQNAFVVSERVLAARASEDQHAELEAALSRYAREVRVRIVVVSTNAASLIEVGGPSPCAIPLAERPEIAEALQGGYSARSRLTPDGRFMYYYVARPIKTTPDRRVIGVAYVVRHTGPIINAIRQMVMNQRRATVWAFSATLLAAGLLAFTLSRRLRALTRATRAYAAQGPPFEHRTPGRDEVAELGHALERMTGELESRHRYNHEFVATTIHEVRAPLTAIKAALEVASDPDAPPDVRARFLERVSRQTERMIRLVGDIRELGKVDGDSSLGERRKLELGPFIHEALGRLEGTFEQPHARLRTTCEKDAGTVSAVPGRLEQVLANLLDNAFRFTPHDGDVTIAVAREGQRLVRVTVADSGPGIAPEHIERVFDCFFTTEKRGEPCEHGTGLGLAIVRRVIESHGGTVSATSSPDGGAVFSFVLPRL